MYEISFTVFDRFFILCETSLEGVIASSNSWIDTGYFNLRAPYCCCIDNRINLVFFRRMSMSGMHMGVKSLCRGNGHQMKNGVKVPRKN